jgi:succinate dehydrogenase / fumarate reductase flavoprotein subunit
MAGSEDFPLSSSTGGFEGVQEHMSHEVVVIGGGLAGLRAALAAANAGAEVALFTKVHPLRSHSVAAQGGINAALREDDSVESHAFDTVKGSDYLADQDAVMVLASEAPDRVREMERWGTVFSRAEDGRIAQRPFGGAGYPRTAYAQDRTGHNLLHTLYETVMSQRIRIYEEYFITRIVVSVGRCMGVVALNVREGQLHSIQARSVVIATGGYGRIFDRSTNAIINTGDGASLAFRAGAPIEDMEFVQFHPTTLYGTNILMSEGIRGEGGLLWNGEGERFMERYAPKSMELAPRDIVARSIQTEINEGRGIDGKPFVHLDVTHLGANHIKERLPGIRDICINFAGIDPIEKPIPIQPGQHYSMGGLACDSDGATEIAGLLTAGEAACVSVHGANRLGGNSLLETLVFGRRAGMTAASQASTSPEPDEALMNVALREEVARINGILTRPVEDRHADLKESLQKVMFDHFGVFREGPVMEKGLERVRQIRTALENTGIDHHGSVYNQALMGYLEMEFMVELAEVIALGAIAREESRGSHSRIDFPDRDDERWLKHTFAYMGEDGPMVKYRDVTLGHFEVKERVY